MSRFPTPALGAMKQTRQMQLFCKYVGHRTRADDSRVLHLQLEIMLWQEQE